MGYRTDIIPIPVKVWTQWKYISRPAFPPLFLFGKVMFCFKRYTADRCWDNATPSCGLVNILLYSDGNLFDKSLVCLGLYIETQ